MYKHLNTIVVILISSCIYREVIASHVGLSLSAQRSNSNNANIFNNHKHLASGHHKLGRLNDMYDWEDDHKADPNHRDYLINIGLQIDEKLHSDTMESADHQPSRSKGTCSIEGREPKKLSLFRRALELISATDKKFELAGGTICLIGLVNVLAHESS